MDSFTRRLFFSFFFVTGAMALLDLIYFTDENGSPQNDGLWFPVFFVVVFIAFLLFSHASIGNIIASIRAFLLNSLLRHGPATRSEWEKAIEERMRTKYPKLQIVTNDHSIVPKREGIGYLEIDLWIPSIRLAIEANGETYHDHDGYLQDVRRGTVHTSERYKEVYCQRRGITFLHVWSSDSDIDIDKEIDNAVRLACFTRNCDYDYICRIIETFLPCKSF